ncbi:MAG: hypothetical protein LBR99_05155 [Treponema sp.]|jgi:hypothetical protein|nr:hypothetical protein [Treponema sp.]
MNRALLLIITLTVLVSLAGTAQEAKQLALGLGVDGNMNTRKGAALGGTVSAGYGIIPNLAAGIKIGFSHNFDTIMTLEPEVFARWYFLDSKNISPFVQAGLGTSVFFEDGAVYPAFLGDLSAGLRIPFSRQWYTEAYLRAGYPFIWGAGIIAGYRF